MRWFVFFSAVGSFLVGPAARQQPIHVEVNLVNVSFTVRDSYGALVGNLNKDDFEVSEDDLPQKIAFFARSTDVPLTLGVILDASGSQEHFTKKHEKDLEVFMKDVLGPKDRAFLLCFGNHLRLVNDYTQSGDQMFEHLKEYEKKSDPFPEIGPKERRDLGTAFYDSIYYSVTEKLAKESGRRALLIFSDGEDNSSSHDMMTTIEAAQQENVLVFTIRYTEREHGQLTARNKYGIRVMDRIAKETGGAHRRRNHRPAHLLSRDRRRVAQFLRVGLLPQQPAERQHFSEISDPAEAVKLDRARKNRLFQSPGALMETRRGKTNHQGMVRSSGRI